MLSTYICARKCVVSWKRGTTPPAPRSCRCTWTTSEASPLTLTLTLTLPLTLTLTPNPNPNLTPNPTPTPTPNPAARAALLHALRQRGRVVEEARDAVELRVRGALPLQLLQVDA